MKKIILNPRKAKTHKEISQLESDNISTEDYWILISPKYVTICKQKIGIKPENSISIPREDFDKLVEWYLLSQKMLNQSNENN